MHVNIIFAFWVLPYYCH